MEDPTQCGLEALGSQPLEQRDQEPISHSPALRGHQRCSPLTSGGPDSLAPSIQIRLRLRFNLGCESTDVIRTENKWEHYLQNKEQECFLDLVQLDD